MPPWFAMPPREIATRKAALTELRTTFAAIRTTAELIGRRTDSDPERALAWAIARCAARGERAVVRLERLPSAGRG
jgi:hypothetical protein